MNMLAPIISNEEVASGVHLLWVEAPAIAAAARPGQFVMVRCGEELLLRRPLSIHQVEPGSNPARLAFLFAVVGKGTGWLSRQRHGSVDLLSPRGNGFWLGPAKEPAPSSSSGQALSLSKGKLLLVAGGMGIAPLAFLAQRALGQGHEVTLIVGARTASSLHLDFPPAKRVELVTVTEDGSKGKKGLATDYLTGFLPGAGQVFACGPMEMYRAMAAHKALRGKSVQVSLEARMGCGFGACFGCTIKTTSGLKQVCKDGPVFELKEIVWESQGGV
ncbi:MAG: dihydroorotate dehydrogenase electron transfer subunit [Dehalococcoidia bacterium]|nr:dihydroorotate dehydrogenase electron transfer subunit [Dehalococcoidia bacterium]